MKTCNKCKEVKPKAEFHKLSCSKDGLHYTCKACRNAKQEKYRKAHIEQQKKYYETNKEHIRKQQEKYYKANIEHIREYKKEYQKKYRKVNAERIKEYSIEYRNAKRLKNK